MNDHSNPSRRHFLRGAGVALTLPWMESLQLLKAQDGVKAAAAAKAPLRFGVIYFSNGVDPKNWSAKGRGAAMEFGSAAQPLAPIRRYPQPSIVTSPTSLASIFSKSICGTLMYCQVTPVSWAALSHQMRAALSLC